MADVITIDGPVASGKGTVASNVAKHLGWRYLDSGVLYRLLALLAKRSLEGGLGDEEGLSQLAETFSFTLKDGRVYLGHEDVSKGIREEVISRGASQIALFPKVRESLLRRQRNYAQDYPLVADGRDMGSVVFPQAVLKVYLTASLDSRAQRRAKQLGIEVGSREYQELYDSISHRDKQDITREFSPLVKARGSYVLDSSSLSIEEVVQKIVSWYRQTLK
ncbi:MAG: (d)CMP kinase [Neisseriaceae bacterium]